MKFSLLLGLTMAFLIQSGETQRSCYIAYHTIAHGSSKILPWYGKECECWGGRLTCKKTDYICRRKYNGGGSAMVRLGSTWYKKNYYGKKEKCTCTNGGIVKCGIPLIYGYHSRGGV